MFICRFSPAGAGAKQPSADIEFKQRKTDMSLVHVHGAIALAIQSAKVSRLTATILSPIDSVVRLKFLA